MPDVLMDTGVIFALLPFQSLEHPGIKPGVKHRLRTADGRIVERDVASVLSGDNSAPANKSMANTIIRRNIYND